LNRVSAKKFNQAGCCSEAFENGSILFKFKKDEDFNHRHTWSISRIELKLHFVQNAESDTEIGQKGTFFKGLEFKGDDMEGASITDQNINRKKMRHNLLIIKATLLVLPISVLAYILIGHHILKPGQVIMLALTMVLMLTGLVIVWQLIDKLFKAHQREEAEKRKLEVMLIQSQKMEAIGALAGGITHDFNNILAAILGYTELALLGDRLDSPAKRNLEQIQKACQRARELVNHILAFRRHSKQEIQPVQISAIVKEGLKMLRASIPASIKISQQIESENGLVDADPTQIHQVLMNLGINAAHAMRDYGGTIKVILAEKKIDPEAVARYPEIQPGSYLRLTVSDEGHGMAPELLNHIFDPYFTTKEKDGGSGLGLAVVHGIVKRHGGAITVKSELHKGTTVHIYFPKAKQLEPTNEILTDQSMPTGDERILFIDDEQNLVYIGKEMLEYLGYEVTASTSSAEALELFQSRPDRFDLVITDMTMPQITGEKLAQELIKIRSDIPIIICTGFSEKVTPENAKMIGIKEFAMKPLLMQDLAKTIRRVLAA